MAPAPCGFLSDRKDTTDMSANARLEVHQFCFVPLISAFETWLITNCARVSSQVPLGETLQCIAKYGEGLCLLPTDGRVEMDNNPPLSCHCRVEQDRNPSYDRLALRTRFGPASYCLICTDATALNARQVSDHSSQLS